MSTTLLAIIGSIATVAGVGLLLWSTIASGRETRAGFAAATAERGELRTEVGAIRTDIGAVRTDIGTILIRLTPAETPAEQPAAVETPAAAEQPAVETPAVETPAVETPAVETPAVAVVRPSGGASVRVVAGG